MSDSSGLLGLSGCGDQRNTGREERSTVAVERGYRCFLQARSFSLRGWGLIDLPLRATFSPAHPLARRDVPVAQARGVRDRALREHRR
jgi:hypothetical protein